VLRKQLALATCCRNQLPAAAARWLSSLALTTRLATTARSVAARSSTGSTGKATW